MDRFNYRVHTLTVTGEGRNVDDEFIERVEDIEGYAVYDMRAGNTDDVWVAFSRDFETAERIVRLLNNDERLRMQASLKGAASE